MLGCWGVREAWGLEASGLPLAGGLTATCPAAQTAVQVMPAVPHHGHLAAHLPQVAQVNVRHGNVGPVVATGDDTTPRIHDLDRTDQTHSHKACIEDL